MAVISVAILVITILIYGIFQFSSYNKYRVFEPLDNKTYSYKKFLPGCLGIVENCNSQEQVDTKQCLIKSL